MHFLKILFVFIPTIFVHNFTMAGAISISNGDMIYINHHPKEITTTNSTKSISDDTTPIVLLNDYNILVNGDLYIDYSVFSENTDLTINSNTSFIGETINIFPYNEIPTMPDLRVTTVFQEPKLSLIETGDILLFSNIPLTNGIFEATNIFIGNYSSIKPVPLPPSLILFLIE